MALSTNSPTKALLAEVIRSHLAGKLVVGADTSPTGTGKTTSSSQFFHDPESFLQSIGKSTDLKVVIVASQHRYLGNYWVKGNHQLAIRFLGADEYARRLRKIAKAAPSAAAQEEEMVCDGLIPHRCPLRGNSDWQKSLLGAAERSKAITFTDYREICKGHLKEKLESSDPAQLFDACNHACPLAGGAFFGVALPHDSPDGKKGHARHPGHPRLALLTTAKFRYRAAAFYLHHGEIMVRTPDFQDIRDAVILFEEAADAFASMLGYVDEKAVSTELLSTAALAHELFNRRQFEHDWIKHFCQRTATIYLGAARDTIVQDGKWMPVNVYQQDPKHRGDYLLPVSRDRSALAMADYARYATHKETDGNGAQLSFSLLIKGVDPPETAYSPDVVKPARVDPKVAATRRAAPGNVIPMPPMTASLGPLVQAIYAMAIKPFVRFFPYTHHRAGSLTFREHVSNELNKTFQLHRPVREALRDLALSKIYSESNVKSLRDSEQDVFAEDYYYKHGIAYCEVHRPQRDATERDPLHITLNVSYPPPEQLVYNLLRQHNSIIFSSATLRLKSPYTNLNLDWILRKHLGDLAEQDGAVKHEVIDLDDPGRPELHRLKRLATDRLIEARHWEDRPLPVCIFKTSNDKEDTEYLEGYQALITEIRSLNKLHVPAIGIVMVNSYAHAEELLRRLEYAHVALNIGELYAVNTDFDRFDRPGLSTLDTWITGGEIQRGANGTPNPMREPMLFDDLEAAVSARMGPLLSRAKPLNGLVVSVIQKIGKGASFRVDLTNVKLGRCGRAYLGDGIDVDRADPCVDFNLVAFAEHPRNLVNVANYRRIAVQGVSIGGRDMQEKLTQQLRCGEFKPIQCAMKWSRFGALAVTDLTVQGAGRMTRCRTPLPVHRRFILSDKQARLVMLGLGYCSPGDLLFTPDLARIRDTCLDYWMEATIACTDEDAGAAEWVSNVYRQGGKRSARRYAELKAVRDIRTFLSQPEHYVFSSQDAFDKATAGAFQDDYGVIPQDLAVRDTALARLRQSYLRTSTMQLARASVSKRSIEIILNHGPGRLSLISYRQKLPPTRGRNPVMLLKPRELHEIAYPAADEAAVLRMLDAFQARGDVSFQVQSALDNARFMHPIRNGTHEAGDFYLLIKGFKLLLDNKTTGTGSIHNPELRGVDSVRAEVLSKTARFERGTGIKVDAFVFANSGWNLQDMWYPDVIPRCGVPVFHMDACTTLSPARMAIEFQHTLTEIVTYLATRRSAAQRRSSQADG
ncbi:hypothetical protein [Paraburkholderia sp. JHI869]|uniref:hypothetical protein n=1 Tax=Paraburkholderia sp. JHI869 TaxID=3112959 RepID=UPI003175D3EF